MAFTGFECAYRISSFKCRGVCLILGLLGAAFISKIKNDIPEQGRNSGGGGGSLADSENWEMSHTAGSRSSMPNAGIGYRCWPSIIEFLVIFS